jgi:hypothetical protein
MRRLKNPAPPGACAPFPSPPRPPSQLAPVVRLEGPPLALPRDGEDDPQRPRCFPCWRTPRGGGGPGPANRTRTFTPAGVGRYPQVVPNMWIRGPRLFHRAPCPAQTEQGRAQELDTEGRSARDRYVWSAPAAPPRLLRSGRSAASDCRSPAARDRDDDPEGCGQCYRNGERYRVP